MAYEDYEQVQRARDGDRDILEELVAGVRDKVYGLAMRMLHHPQDAEDATQEIIIRIITHLSQFRGESAFSSWVYRVAANYLLATRKQNALENEINFEGFAQAHDEGLPALQDYGSGPDADLLEEDVKIGCSGAMLMCLDRPHRLAFILGKILELPSKQSADILEISDAAYRKRLSRAHERIREFMAGRCGLVNPANPCVCRKRIGYAIKVGNLNPAAPVYASQPGERDKRYLRAEVEKMDELHRTVAVFRGHPRYQAPPRFVSLVRQLIHSPRFDASLGSESG